MLTLTNGCEPFTSTSYGDETTNNQEIAEETSWYWYTPHHQVWQRWVNTIILDRELQHFAHIFGQIAHHNIEAPIVTDLQTKKGRTNEQTENTEMESISSFYLSAHECNHWNAGQNLNPWSWWQIILTLQLTKLRFKIFTFFSGNEWMRAWITVANYSLKKIDFYAKLIEISSKYLNNFLDRMENLQRQWTKQ